MVRRALFLCGLTALMAVVLLQPTGAGRHAAASHDLVTLSTLGDEIAIDMVTSNNGADWLGDIDPCVSAPSGVPVEFDVVLDGLPPGNNLGGFRFTLTPFPGTSLAGLTVTSRESWIAGVNIITNQGLSPGPPPFVPSDFSVAAPGPLEGFQIYVTDVYAPEAYPDTVRGVLTRFTIDTTAAVPGHYRIALTNADLLNSAGTFYSVDDVIDAFAGYGIIAVGQPCPPTFTVNFDEGEGPTDPSSPPEDNECVATWHCEQRFMMTIADSQPLVLPELQSYSLDTADYTITRGQEVANGSQVAAFDFRVQVDLGVPDCAGTVPAVGAGFLVDGGLKGEVPDDPFAAALANPLVWPTRLEASPSVAALLPDLWARYVTFVPAVNSAVNVLVFKQASSGEYRHLTIVGDALAPPPSGTFCGPAEFDVTYMGSTATGQVLRSCDTVGPKFVSLDSPFTGGWPTSCVTDPDPDGIEAVIDGSFTTSAAITGFVASPFDVTLNPETNRIYAASLGGGFGTWVTVIDGAMYQEVAGVFAGSTARNVGSIAVNPVTNRIYVSDQSAGTVSVIDGNTNAVIATVASVGTFPNGVAVNPITNLIYVGNLGDASVSVIDGATNSVVGSPIPVGSGPGVVGVNPKTNRIYTANHDSNDVSVINGATRSVVATVPVGVWPRGLAVNPETNRIYVANNVTDTVSVIDGNTNDVIATVPVGDAPMGVAVNPNTNRIYVGNPLTNNISVIDGDSNSVVGTIPVGDEPRGVAVNPKTDRVYAVGEQLGVLVCHGATNICGTFSNESLVASTRFADQHIGGKTFGQITALNGASARITELPNPAGVKVAASGTGGPVRVQGCALPVTTVDVYPGKSATFTCGSGEVEALVGPITVSFGSIQASAPTGTKITVTETSPGVFQVVNDSQSDAPFTVGGLTLAPGQTEVVQDSDADGWVDVADNDDDGDGYWDDDESAKGSVVLDAASTPEHCDAVDNDGDTLMDEEPAGANWDIDGDAMKDCLDATVDTDGDGIVNTVDTDDDGDGRTDAQERKLSTDELGACPTGASHDAWPPDRDRDRDADVGDVIQAFGVVPTQKINKPANYDARSDADGDGDVDVGDAIILYKDKINTRCATFTFTNGTGGGVDDIHIVWSQAIAEVYVARDSALAGWSNRTLSGDGTVLDMDRPDGSGDLASGGQLTVVVRAPVPVPAVSSCRWTLDGLDVGAC